MNLPLIDISPFITNVDDTATKATAASLHIACKEVGFFYVTGFESIIKQSELDKALQLGHEFFKNTPQEEKNALNISKNDGARGYQKLGENVTLYKKDWHEGLDLYKPIDNDHYLRKHPTPSSGASLYPLLAGNNIWPSASFESFFSDYKDKMLHLGSIIMSAMGLGLMCDTKLFESYTNESFWVMRIIGYPPLQTASETETDNDIGISCGQHCDYGLLTLLNQDPISGSLQVKLPSTGEWVSADRIKGALVVNIGDMVQIFTNGLYKSTLHRVIHKSHQYRVSIPFFFEPNFDALIKPLNGVVQGDSLSTEQPIKYGDHLLSKVSGNFSLGAIQPPS